MNNMWINSRVTIIYPDIAEEIKYNKNTTHMWLVFFFVPWCLIIWIKCKKLIYNSRNNDTRLVHDMEKVNPKIFHLLSNSTSRVWPK